MSIINTISLLGGLGFFLFGMSLLGDGLQRVAGSKLEMILGKMTSTTFRGVLLGTLVTAVIQSSSATTVMVVGIVNSDIMKLTNAIGVIMGANIGTTATSWILVLAGVEGSGGFSSTTLFALISFIGIILFFFCTKPVQKNVGMIMLAFSVLMSGMQTMSNSMTPLKESAAFLNFISAVSSPLIALSVGIVVTALIQSCSASIGILQALSVTGVISYEIAIPMVLGMCIGACVPVLLSAIGANVNGKRAAFVYLYFNLAGSVLLMVPFYLINAFFGLNIMSETANSMGIAIVNTVYKVMATLLLVPFSGVLEKLAVTTIKEKPINLHEGKEKILDDSFLAYPSLALEQCGKIMRKMYQAAFRNLNESIELLHEFDQNRFDKIIKREDRVDRYEDSLGSYLVKLNSSELTEKESLASSKYLSFITNAERISDHTVNIAELAKELAGKQTAFSEQAKKELQICLDAVLEITELTQSIMEDNDLAKARMVEPLEDVIDGLTKDLKMRHIQRVQTGNCTLELGFIFNDCINNLERVADHCSNIAIVILETADFQLQSHGYLRTLKQTNREEYLEQLESYAKKYYKTMVPEE